MQLTEVFDRWPVGVMDNSWRGRVSDVCVLGLSPLGDDARFGVEDWLFGAGRPCLLYPNNSKRVFSAQNVLVCWDVSRSAARTVSDALPLLHNANRVRVAVFRGEKEIAADDAAKLLTEFLERHGVNAEAEEIDVGKRKIGQAILEYAESASADLVVMGAYGHSRLNEFLLGGATKYVLDKSTIPILMSH
jgi:nucleotide-binding universal stress UspA family protein